MLALKKKLGSPIREQFKVGAPGRLHNHSIGSQRDVERLDVKSIRPWNQPAHGSYGARCTGAL